MVAYYELGKHQIFNEIVIMYQCPDPKCGVTHQLRRALKTNNGKISMTIDAVPHLHEKFNPLSVFLHYQKPVPKKPGRKRLRRNRNEL